MGLHHLTEKIKSMKPISTAKPNRERNTDRHSYDSWLKKHPSALELLDRMMTTAEGKQIVLFLDYDGTLSPIVDDPDAAFMSDKMRTAVYEAGRCFSTSIISGRSRDKVYDFVQLDNIYYAGSHGLDIMAPLHPARLQDQKHHTRVVHGKCDNVVIYQPAQEFLPEVEVIKKSLNERTKGIAGVKIEDNHFCMSVHFRNVHEKNMNKLEETVRSIIEEHPQFQLANGKKVFEIRPVINWNKGHAVEYLIDSLGFETSSSTVFPIYIGDDRTDEDAFKVIQTMGQGYSIIVTSTPRETRASYSLCNTSEVRVFLESLARMKRRGN